MLHEHAGQGLTVLLGPGSEPVTALSAGRADRAEQLLARWRELAGANLRLEVMWWGLPGTGPGSLRLAARTLGLADRLGVPAVPAPVAAPDAARKALAELPHHTIALGYKVKANTELLSRLTT